MSAEDNNQKKQTTKSGSISEYFKKDLEDNDGKVAIKIIGGAVVVAVAKIGSNLIKYLWTEAKKFKAKAGKCEISASKQSPSHKKRSKKNKVS